MDWGKTEYFTLLASLPAMPRDFKEPPLPISEPRLRNRLGMLTSEDARILRQLETFLRWERQPREQTDADFARVYERIQAELDNPLCREIVEFLMDIRFLTAAQRCRRQGQSPMPCLGRWGPHIRSHWDAPGFGLLARFPWLDTLEQHWDEQQVMAAEQLLTEVMWNFLLQLTDRYYFDFEAVMVYLARWDIINNWLSHDPEEGRQRFDELTEEALGEYVAIFD